MGWGCEFSVAPEDSNKRIDRKIAINASIKKTRPWGARAGGCLCLLLPMDYGLSCFLGIVDNECLHPSREER